MQDADALHQRAKTLLRKIETERKLTYGQVGLTRNELDLFRNIKGRLLPLEKLRELVAHLEGFIDPGKT